MIEHYSLSYVLNGLGMAFVYRRGDDVWTKFSQLPNTIMVNFRLDDVIYHMGDFYAVDALMSPNYNMWN